MARTLAAVVLFVWGIATAHAETISLAAGGSTPGTTSVTSSPVTTTTLLTGRRSKKRCRQACSAAIGDCFSQEGGRPHACQRLVLRLCRQVGVCPLPRTTTTTFTTTTTIATTPYIALTIESGGKFATQDPTLFFFTVRVFGGLGNLAVNLDPSQFYVITPQGTRYGADADPGFPTNYCSAAHIVQPQGADMCNLRFTMPLAINNGVLWFEASGYKASDSFIFPP